MIRPSKIWCLQTDLCMWDFDFRFQFIWKKWGVFSKQLWLHKPKHLCMLTWGKFNLVNSHSTSNLSIRIPNVTIQIQFFTDSFSTYYFLTMSWYSKYLPCASVASIFLNKQFQNWISLKHDDVKNQNKPAELCIVGFIGGPLNNNTVIILPF